MNDSGKVKLDQVQVRSNIQQNHLSSWSHWVGTLLNITHLGFNKLYWDIIKMYMNTLQKYQFKSVQILITIIAVAYRKSYLFIICPISTKQLMKYVIRSSWIQF